MTELTAKDVTVHITEYQVTVLPVDDINAITWSLTVAYRGHGRYAVLRGRWCLSRTGEWDYESIPSDREAEWIETHRFEHGEALRLAVEHAPHVKVNGMTATEVLADIRAVEGGDTP